MPELPEVESLRLSLKPYIIGQTIQAALVHKPKLVSNLGTKRLESASKKLEFETVLPGKQILDITRIAKNLLIHLTDGSIVLVHLKMTGQLVYQEKGQNKALGGHPIQASELALPNKHSHIIIELNRGTLYYNDIRMFGYMLYFANFEAVVQTGHFEALGQDPLDTAQFKYEYFYQSLKSKKTLLKSLLLSQSIVTGLGNIYADEVCFEAKILPFRNTSTLTDQEIQALYQAIIRIISRAVAMGGSSVANYIMADGSRGTYVREHKVYGKAGQPCLICGNLLSKKIIASRTTVFCQFCQK